MLKFSCFKTEARGILVLFHQHIKQNKTKRSRLLLCGITQKQITQKQIFFFPNAFKKCINSERNQYSLVLRIMSQQQIEQFNGASTRVGWDN